MATSFTPLRFFKVKQPVLLIAIVALCFFFGGFIPAEAKSFFYALSITIKELLMTVLPFIIFSYLFNSMYNLKEGAISFVFLLLGMVCISNLLSVLMSYPVGVIGLKEASFISKIKFTETPLVGLWDLSIPRFIKNEYALLTGFLTGILCSILDFKPGQVFGEKCVKTSNFILNRLFIPVLPFFILGFALKLQHDDILEALFKDYVYIFLLILVAQFTYISLMYGLMARFHPKVWWGYLQNMIPAIITAFTTASSVAAMPLMMRGTEKNMRNPELVKGVIPATVNIHMIGDSFSIPILTMSLMMTLGTGFPDFSEYLIFAGLFAVAKFSAAAVPGGTILVMLPVLDRSLGFTPDMLSLITAMYIMFDPINTPANVLGNGAFAMIFERAYEKLQKLSFKKSSKEIEKVL